MTDQRERQALETLVKTFKHAHFRSDTQRKAVLKVLDGKEDVFICMPTGAGKSLCYQLPAVMSTGLTLVISPLIALMQDQLEHLENLGICSETLNSKMSAEERRRVLKDLSGDKPETKLLYITPEQVDTDSFKSLAEMLMERRLGVPCIALTATAPKQVIEDIVKQLRLREPMSRFKQSVYRPNLYYEVKMKDTIGDVFEDLKIFAIKSLGGAAEKGENWDEFGCGIVYCRTRDSCEEVAAHLTRKGIPARPYHAGLKSGIREGNQIDWMAGRFPVICATISFGMGVDKSNVRFVAHWNVPKSMAGFYQESGRAGRDGKQSYCRLYYSQQDRDTVAFLIKKETSRSKKKDKDAVQELLRAAMKNFEIMISFCEEVSCRHWSISKFFGDDKPECGKSCDACKEPREIEKQLQELRRGMFASVNKRKGGAGTMFYVEEDGADEMYGKGRKGAKMDTDDYDSQFLGDDDDETQEARDRKQRSSFIQKQFKIRKNNAGITNEEFIPPSDDCPLREADSQRIPKLTVAAREHCMELLEKALLTNYCQFYRDQPSKQAAQDYVPRCTAIDMEHAVFKGNKLHNIYKTSIMRKVMDVKKSTTLNQLHPSMAPETPVSTVGTSSPDPGDSTLPALPCLPLIESEDTVGAVPDCDNTTPSCSSITECVQNKDCDKEFQKLLGDSCGKTTDCMTETESDSSTNKDTSANLDELASKNTSIIPPKPKMVYFFERGDSLKKENEENRFDQQIETRPSPVPIPEPSHRSKRPLDKTGDAGRESKHRRTEDRHSASGGDSGRMKECADLVVKYLSPHFKAGRIANKDLFKQTAKKLTHHLANSSSNGTEPVKESVKRLIKGVFSKVKVISSESAVKSLKL
ncbi:RECQ5-like protein [Mya arenaria]|uniref:DNA 3'-5' helicase n=1 Tax=Mya arenaria TaxID=6604 RepID=A0ABY7DP98_MYAAR|nr:RECQ5-like protein [Mya arenaria]